MAMNEAPEAPLPTTLAAWLAHCERLHHTEIDLTLDRVHAVLARLQLRFEAPVITVAGTNGKGSTCAMLEAIALAAGYRVGLFSKPHLVHFEERCRVNGQSVAADALVPHFAAVEQARGDISLSYFEFTLLAIARLLSQTPLDLIILEVGLGGRLDAVNAFDTDCAVITSIALDHTEYLGPDREAIGREKAHIMRPGVPAVISDPAPPQSVIDYAQTIGTDWRCVGRDFRHEGDAQQWSWQGRAQRYSGLAYPALRGANQLANASGVLAAFEALRERLPISAQAVRKGLALVALPGRFQVIAGQPTVVLDVAHNPHAVATLAHNLDQMGFFPCTHAVLGAMRDKDLPLMLQRLAPLVDRWYFTDLPTARAASALELMAVHGDVCISKPEQPRPSCHANPAEALRAAHLGANPADRILVFGSFYTVGGVLAEGLPRLTGQNFH
jgi:dihydrofolate synthase / folylpolyglutamate synthase